ncbi:hypothetical protein BOG92_034905 [Streptomyces sp. WAC00263]|nr:hypothetical protein BOG92_034905 [Streptomyces sp. WAC00263]
MAQAPATPRVIRRQHDGEIVVLAVPAFGALAAEPLFVMADSAVVHLGTAQLPDSATCGPVRSRSPSRCPRGRPRGRAPHPPC